MKMNKQFFIPYEGTEPFIFFSYSHINIEEVQAIIQRLQSDGYRVWYDEGIHPGVEWDDSIAENIGKCSLFLALISEEYLESTNCRDELYYARTKERNRVLIYLTDVKLPAGMELRLGRLQSVFKYKYDLENDFYSKLYSSAGIENCRSATPINQDTVSGSSFPVIILNGAENKQIITIEKDGNYLIGRSYRCQIIIWNTTVSLKHAMITVRSKDVYLSDLYSGTGTRINDIKILPGQMQLLQNNDKITIGNTDLYYADNTLVIPEKEE